MGIGWSNSKFLFLIAFASLIFVFNSSNAVFAEHPDSSAELTMHEKIKWLETNYSSMGTAVVQVVSPDMNFDPKAIDNFDVDVWSDTDFAGIDLTVTETGDATGTFEGTVFFTVTDDTSGHRLRVSHGDTIYSKFDGNTLYESLDADKNDLTSTASMNGADIHIDDRVSLDKKSYAWNDKVLITINAPEENFDANSIEIIDSSKDSIKIYTRHFGIDNYSLVETGIDSGIFSGKIPLTGEFDNIDSDGVTVSFEYDEDKTAIGSAPITLNSEPESILNDRCGVDTVSIDGICQVVKVEKTKTVSDDAPFFGIFVYLDDLISWIFGNDYDEYGLKINFVELREISQNNLMSGYDKHHTTTIDTNSWYTVVSEIQNRDDVEKDFFYEVIFVEPNGDIIKSTNKESILPYDTILVDTGGGDRMYPGEYTVDVYLYEHRSVRDQAVPFSQVWVLEENEN